MKRWGAFDSLLGGVALACLTLAAWSFTPSPALAQTYPPCKADPDGGGCDVSTGGAVCDAQRHTCKPTANDPCTCY